MSERRDCPLCSRQHEVADDGTIPTWDVSWQGQEQKTIEVARYLSDERCRRLTQLRQKYPERTKLDEQNNREGFISNRVINFIHYEDAVSEYSWIKSILERRGDWEVEQGHLTLTEGERASWYELFESEEAIWLA